VSGIDFGSGLTLRPSTISDLPGLLSVCLQTADSGANATDLHNLPDLVGEIYAAPYVLHDLDFAFVLASSDEVVGYVLGALDTNEFEEKLASDYWPVVREKYKSLAIVPTVADLGLLETLKEIGASSPSIVNDFPSHLHIDIIEKYQGFGYGRLMISHLLNQLKLAGSTGVHLHLSSSNSRALAFYEKFNFSTLTSDSNEIIMGLKFD
jgi:ribosomal protein S18 acetylase RimI-like enzyme